MIPLFFGHVLLIFLSLVLYFSVNRFGVGATWVFAYNPASGGYSEVAGGKLVGKEVGRAAEVGAQGT